MNNLKTKILILGLAWFCGASVTFAQTPSLTATFSSQPLFNIVNFVPGNSSSAWIEMQNNTATTKDAYIEAVGSTDPSDLASKIKIEISEGEIEIYEDNFKTFLNAGPISLSQISSNSSQKYDLKLTFLEANDDFQNKTLGFDICVAFWGGDLHCTDTTVVSPEQEGGDNGGTGGGGGGFSSGSRHLLISSENATPFSTQALITWNTNIPATTQVIYGLESGAPYTLDINILPGMGYPFSTTEDLSKILNHSVNLTGLIPGETYVYRVVSRASPPSVSFEGRFTVPGTLVSNSISNLGNTQNNSSNLIESVNGVSGEFGTTTATSTEGEILGALDVKNLANVFSGGLMGNWTKWAFWIIILLLIIYFIWKKKTGNNLE